MSWIKNISFEAATGKLKRLYQRVSGPDNNIDNILLAHSLRPHTLEGHMVLYKNVLHHSSNVLAKHQLEALGIYVSLLNQCDYCVEHHFQGYKNLLNDDLRAEQAYRAMISGELGKAFNQQQMTLFEYARKLTLSPATMESQDLQNMRDVGYDDGVILEVNQVIAYFNYANRTVLGLGVDTEGDIIGLSPNDSDDPDNWEHR